MLHQAWRFLIRPRRSTESTLLGSLRGLSQSDRRLRSRMDDGRAVPAGWVREVARGRVCHLANGHPAEPLFHPMYQKLLRNAVRLHGYWDGFGF